jgi:hypothetical protein
MEELLGLLIFVIIALVAGGVALNSKLSQQSATPTDRPDSEDRKRDLEEEILARQHELLAQGDETIALLKALNENMEHRTTKN